MNKIPAASKIATTEVSEERQERDKAFKAACDAYYDKLLVFVGNVAKKMMADGTQSMRINELEEFIQDHDARLADTNYPIHVLHYGLYFRHKTGEEGKFRTNWQDRKPFPEGTTNPFMRAQQDLKEKKQLYLTDSSNPARSKQIVIYLSTQPPHPRVRLWHGMNKMPGDADPYVNYRQKRHGHKGQKNDSKKPSQEKAPREEGSEKASHEKESSKKVPKKRQVKD